MLSKEQKKEKKKLLIAMLVSIGIAILGTFFEDISMGITYTLLIVGCIGTGMFVGVAMGKEYIE